MEHIWHDANVFTWLGLWSKCGSWHEKSTRYYWHGMYHSPLEPCHLQFNRYITPMFLQDWSTEGYQLFMLRQRKIFQDEGNSDASTSNPSNATTMADNVPRKPILTHTYSNLSDKSFVTNEQPYTVQTTLVQLHFVKSSFTVNPCMVSILYTKVSKQTRRNPLSFVPCY